MAEGSEKESVNLDSVAKDPDSLKEVSTLVTQGEETSKDDLDIGSSLENSVPGKFLRRNHKYSHNINLFSKPKDESTKRSSGNNVDCQDEKEFDFGTLVDFVIVDEVEDENDEVAIENSKIISIIDSSNECSDKNGQENGSQREQNMVILDNLDLDEEGDEFYIEVKNLSEGKELISKKDCEDEKELARKQDLAKIKVSVKEASKSSKAESSLKKEPSPLKKREPAPLKKREPSPFKEREPSSGHVCRIPGLSFIIGIKPDEPSDLKKNRYDCVLCSSKKEDFDVLFTGSEMKSHAQSRRHVLNVMRVWNHDYYQNYLRYNSSSWITTGKLLEELLKYEATIEKQKIVVASKKTYSQQRESVNFKIKILLDELKTSNRNKVVVTATSAKISTASHNKIIASPVSYNDSAIESITNLNKYVGSPVSSSDSTKESVASHNKIVVSPVSPNDSAKESIPNLNKYVCSPVSSVDSAKESVASHNKIVASPVSSSDSAKESVTNLNKYDGSPVSRVDSAKESIAGHNKIVASPVSSDDSAKISSADKCKVVAFPVSFNDSAKECITNVNIYVGSPVSSVDSAKESVASHNKIVASPVSSDGSAKENITNFNKYIGSPVSSVDSAKESAASHNKIVASPVSSDDSAKISSADKCKVVASPMSNADDLISKKCSPTSNEHMEIKKVQSKKLILAPTKVGVKVEGDRIITSESNIGTKFMRVTILADCHFSNYLKKIKSNKVAVIFTDGALKMENLKEHFMKECSKNLSKNTLYLFALGLHFITYTEPWSACKGFKCRVTLENSMINSNGSVGIVKFIDVVAAKVAEDIECIKMTLPVGSNIAILPPVPTSIFPIKKLHQKVHDMFALHPETIITLANHDKLFQNYYPIFMEKFSSLSYTSLTSCCTSLQYLSLLIIPNKSYSLKVRLESSCEETDIKAWLTVADEIIKEIGKEKKLSTFILPNQDIQEPVKDRIVWVTNLSENTTVEAVKSYFQKFGIMLGINMTKQKKGNGKNALLIFSKSSSIECIFKKKPYQIDGRELQVHRSEWSRDKWRVKGAIIVKNETKNINKKNVDSSTAPCEQKSLPNQKSQNVSTSICNQLTIKKVFGNRVLYTVEKVSIDIVEERLRKDGFSAVNSFIDKMEPIYKDRKQSRIVIVTDERENFDKHLSEFDKRVDVLKIDGVKYESSLDVIKKHPCFGKGTIFIFSYGTHDLLQRSVVKECLEFQCPCPRAILAFKNLKYDQNYLVSRAINFNLSILSCTKNDIALFCGLLPVRLNQYNKYILGARTCQSKHPVIAMPQIDRIRYDEYLDAIKMFNNFTRCHAKKLGFEPWQLQSPFSDATKPLTLSNGFNVSPNDDIDRANIVKSLCSMLLLSLVLSDQPNSDLSNKTGESENKITEGKIGEKPECVNESLEKPAVSKANQNCEMYPAFLLQSQIYPHHQSIISNIVNLQKKRAPSNIVIVTDERDNFDLYLANYDARISILKVPGIKFSDAFASVIEHPQFGKGTIFVFSCGTHDLHTQVPFSECTKFECSTPQYIMVNLHALYNIQHLVAKALQLHLAILSSTNDDIALFCGILPIVQHRYNIHVVHHRPCIPFHPAMYPEDCVINNYEEIINYFNSFSKYHAQVLGYTPWDLDASYYVKPIQELLLPNCYNIHPDEEESRINQVKFLCDNLKPTLSSCFKTDISTQNEVGVTTLTLGKSHPINGFESMQSAGMQNEPLKATSSSVIGDIKQLTALKDPAFNEVYFIGRRESVNMLSDCNVKSTLIYYNFKSEFDLDVDIVLDKIGKIPEKSICCLVFDLAIITKTVKSSQCHKYSCEEPLPVCTLRHSVDSFNKMESLIFKELQSIEKFAKILSVHIPVLILPLAPMRIFCDDNDFQMHRIGHTVNTMGFSVVDGSRSLWHSTLQHITSSWISLVKEANRKYDMHNYISNFAENNKEVFSILDFASDFLADWKEQQHWKSFLYSSLLCIVKTNSSYVESVNQRASDSCKRHSSRSISRNRSRSKSITRSHFNSWLDGKRSESPSSRHSRRLEEFFLYKKRIRSPLAHQHDSRSRSHQRFRSLKSNSRSRSRSLNYCRSQLSHRKSRSLSHRKSRSVSTRRSRSLSRGRSQEVNHRRSRSVSRRRSRSLRRSRSRSLRSSRSRSLRRSRSRSLRRSRSRSLNRRRSNNRDIVSNSISNKLIQKSSSHIRTSRSTSPNRVPRPPCHNRIPGPTSPIRIPIPTNRDRIPRPTSPNRRRRSSFSDKISWSNSQDRIPESLDHNKKLRSKNRERSRSNSYTLRQSSKLHTQHSTKSDSKDARSRQRSVTPRSKKSKGVAVKYLRRSEMDSQTSRSKSLNRNSKSHTRTTDQQNSKPSSRTKPSTSATRKRSRSKSTSPVSKRSRAVQCPISSQLPENKQMSIRYTESQLRKKFGAELFEVYAAELKEVQNKFDEEFEAFRTVPEFHPNFELYYERFVDKYGSQYKGKDEHYKDALWRVFWKSHFDAFRKEEFLSRQQKLIKDFETTEALLLRGHKTSPKNESKRDTPFSFEAALSLIEKLSDDIAYLGPSIKLIINKARSLGTTSEGAYDVFTNAENLEVLDFVFNKFKSLSKSSEGELRYMYKKAIEWVPLVITEAEKGCTRNLPLDHSTDGIPIDLNAISKISLGKSTEFTIELIQTALAYEGIDKPSTQLINELFMKVCALHFNLKNG